MRFRLTCELSVNSVSTAAYDRQDHLLSAIPHHHRLKAGWLLNLLFERKFKRRKQRVSMRVMCFTRGIRAGI
jgi:hypothetical protein